MRNNVTILVYLHNNFTTIEACLHSIISLSGKVNNEVIVIDDGSFDGGSDLLSGLNGIRLIKQEFLGVAKSVNLQLKHIGENDFVRINGDVVIKTENWLEKLQDTVYRDDETAIAGARLLYADNCIESDGRNFITGLGCEERHINLNAFKPNDECRPQVMEVDSVSSSFAYYRNDVLKANGYFDENYFPFYTEDDDYCISARKNNFNVVVNPEVQAYHFLLVKSPADLPLTENNAKLISSFEEGKKYILAEHERYWETKWKWNLRYPDLNLIRHLYGNTKICWNIGEKIRYTADEEFPSIDVCLVTWNNLSLLKRMMESLALTDYPKEKINVYITDNGSKDGTVEYLMQLSNFFVFKVSCEFLPINSGVAYGLNLAIIKGCGSLVARLDDDIILPENWLKELVKVFIKRPYCGVTGPKILNENSNNSIQCSDFILYPSYFTHSDEKDNGQADYYSKTIHLRGCCNLYRREVFDKCGLLDVRFSPSQFDDPDHHAAVIARGYEIVYNGHVGVKHKLNSGINNSYAGLSNMQGNKIKFAGKWGYNIYEILDKSIDLSVEGRKIDLEKSTFTSNIESKPYTASGREYYEASVNNFNMYILKYPELNKLIESLFDNSVTHLRNDAYGNLPPLLHLQLNIEPMRITTIMLLYLVYFRLGDVKKAAHFKNLLRILNKKNMEKMNQQSGFFRQNYLDKIINQLKMSPGKTSLEDIIERLITDNQVNLALFVSMFLYENMAT